MSAAIIADYYGYNSIVTGGTRIRRMRRTELSSLKIARCKLRTLSEGRTASPFKPTYLLAVSSLRPPNEEDKSHLKAQGQKLNKRRCYQQRQAAESHLIRINYLSEKTEHISATNRRKRLTDKQKKERYFLRVVQNIQRGQSQKHSDDIVSNQVQVQTKKSLNLKHSNKSIGDQLQASRKEVRQNILSDSDMIVPATNNLKVEKVTNRQSVRSNSRKMLSPAIQFQQYQNFVVNDTATVQKDKNVSGLEKSLISHQNKVNAVNLSVNRQDYWQARSKTASDIFIKNDSKQQTIKLSKSLTPSDHALFNQQQHILINQVEVAQKSKQKHTNSKLNLKEYKDADSPIHHNHIQTSKRPKLEVRQQSAEFYRSSSNIRITMKSAQTKESNNMLTSNQKLDYLDSPKNKSIKISGGKVGAAAEPSQQKQGLDRVKTSKMQASICSLSLESEEAPLLNIQLKVSNTNNNSKRVTLNCKQQSESLESEELSLSEVIKRIVQHDARISCLPLFISNTRNVYQGTLNYERYERLCFLMLKKYLFEKQRMIRSLKGQQASRFVLTGLVIPLKVLRQYIDSEEIQERLLAFINQEAQIYKDLQREYERISHKYPRDKFIKLLKTREVFQKEIMRLLMQQLSRLYGQLRGDEGEIDRREPTQQRFVEIVQIMFLISELSGRPVKSSTSLSVGVGNFDLYYSDNYEKIIETTEYFQQM